MAVANQTKTADLSRIRVSSVFLFFFPLITTIVFCGCLLHSKFKTRLFSGHAVVAVKFLEADEEHNNSENALGVIPSRARTAKDFHTDLLAAEARVIESKAILNQAIWNLDLNVLWGQKYYGGQTLKTWETLPILTNRIAINPFPYKPLIMISYWDDDPIAAAKIANGIAQAYLDFSNTNLGSPGVSIVDAAQPSQKPFNIDKKQDFTSGITWGVASGLAVASVMTGLVCLIKRKPVRPLTAD
jgi:hypothetical protein